MSCSPRRAEPRPRSAIDEALCGPSLAARHGHGRRRYGMDELRKTLNDGLWTSNPALVQLLGLCPLLAITTTAAYGFALGVATPAVLAVTHARISAARA